MEILQVYSNLRDYSKSHYLVQDISADLDLTTDVNVWFNEQFHVTSSLKFHYSDRLYQWKNSPGECIKFNNVFNLVVKGYSWDKPTYSVLQTSLDQLKNICIMDNITHLAMPMICCGKDGLEWPQVYFMLLMTFNDIPGEIVICKI